MVAKMIRWRPWPPASSKKYEVRLAVRKMEGAEMAKGESGERLTVEIRWKGNKHALTSLRRNVRRNFTKEEQIGSDGVVVWDEGFLSVCNLYSYKETAFHPWEIAFTVFDGFKGGPKSKTPVIGTASLNLSEFAPSAESKEFEISLPLSLTGSAAGRLPTLHVSLYLSEVINLESEQRATTSTAGSSASSPPQLGESGVTEKDDVSAIKAGLRRVKILTEYVSLRKTKKSSQEEEGSEGRYSGPSEDGEYVFPSDSDTGEDDSDSNGEGQRGEVSGVRKSFSYGTLAYANCAGGSFFSSTRINSGDEDWFYYDNRHSDHGISSDPSVSISPPLRHTKRSSLLSWRKRKLGFRSPKSKGEPLLKKAYGEDGGDDIDFDRRQLSSDESIAAIGTVSGKMKNLQSTAPDFGDDDDEFAVGSWETKDILSRDGKMKLKTSVFFASMDQRSEQAAGEGACTVLVAVIADWLQSNHGEMPIKSQFNRLIRDGSAEWRKLCGEERYQNRFPDKHFDLETVVEAGMRPISVSPERSFVGFFSPAEGVAAEGEFGFLKGAMSFDSIWEEMESSSGSDQRVFIISWNDHFFVLKVEEEVCYIVDTLGERLQEGCEQAYILKFDGETELVAAEGGEAAAVKGREACREYIKAFLAAIPVRELAADVKKGMLPAGALHQRLQIEFHYTVAREEA